MSEIRNHRDRGGTSRGNRRGRLRSGRYDAGPGQNGAWVFCRLTRLDPNSASTATSRYGTLGAGDTAVGNWTGTNPGVNRRQTGGHPVYGPGYSGGTAAPGGNGTLGASDTAIGGWVGTNPGIDRRSLGGYYPGPGLS